MRDSFERHIRTCHEDLPLSPLGIYGSAMLPIYCGGFGGSMVFGRAEDDGIWHPTNKSRRLVCFGAVSRVPEAAFWIERGLKARARGLGNLDGRRSIPYIRESSSGQTFRAERRRSCILEVFDGLNAVSRNPCRVSKSFVARQEGHDMMLLLSHHSLRFFYS